MALLNEILQYLEDQGVGTVDTTLFKGSMPDDPDAIGCVYATGGSAPDPGFGSTALRFENPTVQIIFRGAAWDYDGPAALAQSAFEAMAAIKAPDVLADPEGVENSIYLLVTPIQQPAPIRRDKKNRYEFTCNFNIMKEPSTVI